MIDIRNVMLVDAPNGNDHSNAQGISDGIHLQSPYLKPLDGAIRSQRPSHESE
jgi:hypothetical protein